MNLRARWQALTNPAEPAEPRADTSRLVRLGGWWLAAGGCALIAWAALAPLDEGVVVHGVVTVDTKRKPVQHLTGGLVEQVLVREGQTVRAGDVVLRLDSGSARADYEGLRQRFLGLRAMESRLAAEQAGAARIVFHEDVASQRIDPLVAQHVAIQEQLLASRRSALRTELAALDQAAEAQREAAKGYAAQLDSRQQQLATLRDERAALSELARDGFVPRLKVLELDRMAGEIETAASELRGERARAERAVAELVLRKAQREQEARKEVDQQLAEVRRELAAEEQRVRALKDALARTEVRAPAGGAVVGLAVQTVGSVVPAGARLMEIVPADEALKLEAQVPPALIDRVRAGQIADLRFPGFSDAPQLVAEGRLETVSADLLVDPATQTGYYLARLSVTQDGARTLRGRQLQPGMPVEVIIKTGERTLLTYLWGPLSRRLAESMTER